MPNNSISGGLTLTSATNLFGSGSTGFVRTLVYQGNELLSSSGLVISPAGTTIPLPNQNPQTITITQVQLTSNIAYYYTSSAVNFYAGQNVTVTGFSGGNTAFNITNQPILAVTGAYFAVAITNGNIALNTAGGSASVNGFSLLYVRNTGSGSIVLTWTPSGGSSESVVALPVGAAIVLVVTPGGGGITALNAATEAPTLPTYTVSEVTVEAGGLALYTGTFPNQQLAGLSFLIAGFTNATNNGTFLCVGSSSTTLSLQNSLAVNESASATAAVVAPPIGQIEYAIVG